MARVVDDLGTEVAVPSDARRIVSLVPNLSEVLATWGLQDRVVGVTDWCVSPEDAFSHAARVRGTKNPDVEAIRDLEPAVVVANEEENRELDVRRLREAGIAVYVTHVRTLDDAAATFERLGAALGVPRAGRQLAGELRTAGTVAGRTPVPTLCPIWRDPWMVVGRDTFAGDLLARAGARVWHPPGDARYPRIELADARAAGVRLVLLPDEPYAFGPSDRAVFDDWPARVHLVDGTALTWWGPGPTSAVRELSVLVATA